jgi:DNA helicase-2/ATP-dependent DNA helicase PcrA
MSNHYTILGAPGSGKTTALVGRIARAVEENLYGGDILICSLTRTAAHEIAERVKLKVQGIEFPHVGTVHALALRALQTIGDSVRLVYDEDLIRDFNRTTKRKLPLNLGNALYDSEGTNNAMRLLAECDRRRAMEQPTTEWPKEVLRFYSQWTTWKEVNGLSDFTDLIVRATATCQQHPAAPRYIFVDEAQDLSRLEMRLIKQWSLTTEKTIVAGDDQQALYEWRGASVKDFIEFAPPEQQYVLPRSYRMSRAIYDRAKKFGDKISVKITKNFDPVGDGGTVVKSSVLNFMNGLHRDLDDGDISSVMLLASCGYMLNKFLHQLRADGVPYHNPYRSRSEGKTWNPLKTQYADAYRCFLMPSEGQQMWTWSQAYRVVSMLRKAPESVITQLRCNAHSRSIMPAEAIDCDELSGFFEAAKAGDHNAFFSALKESIKFGYGGTISSMSYIKRVLDKLGRDALYATPKLIVGTIHSVKGGEADTVYLLPYVSPEAYRNKNNRLGRDGLLRTFYVGASRAKHRLVMVTVPGERKVMWT